MKFCKNLQNITCLADPEWAPFWVNYKMLKKTLRSINSFPIKSRPNLKFPGPTGRSSRLLAPQTLPRHDLSPRNSPSSSQCSGNSTCEVPGPPPFASSSSVAPQQQQQKKGTSNGVKGQTSTSSSHPRLGPLIQSPEEITFFKMLHAEFKKVSYFFGKTQEELAIREARIRQGISIILQVETPLLPEMWSYLSKSIRSLYRDLLLLETYAIMSFCAFSKILKKHDKKTGRSTRSSFMESIVNKAEFAHYPKLRKLIQSAEEMRESAIMPRLEGTQSSSLRTSNNNNDKISIQSPPAVNRPGLADRDEIIFLDAVNHLRKEMLAWRTNVEAQQQRVVHKRNASPYNQVLSLTAKTTQANATSLRENQEVEEDLRVNRVPPATPLVEGDEYDHDLTSSRRNSENFAKRVRTR